MGAYLLPQFLTKASSVLEDGFIHNWDEFIIELEESSIGCFLNNLLMRCRQVDGDARKLDAGVHIPLSGMSGVSSFS